MRSRKGVTKHWMDEFLVKEILDSSVVVGLGGVVFASARSWSNGHHSPRDRALQVPRDGEWYSVALQEVEEAQGNGGSMFRVRYQVLPGLSWDEDFDKVVLAGVRMGWNWERMEIVDRRLFFGAHD